MSTTSLTKNLFSFPKIEIETSLETRNGNEKWKRFSLQAEYQQIINTITIKVGNEKFTDYKSLAMASKIKEPEKQYRRCQ